jgi:hypothetical protein
MDYEQVSDVDLNRLLHEKLPELDVPEVDEFNRHTVIAFLKIRSLENETFRNTFISARYF